MNKKASARLEKKYPIDSDKYKEIIEDNSKKIIEHAYEVAVELAINAKYGSGMLNRATLLDADVSAMREAMSPLKDVLKYQGIMSFARIFNGFLTDPGLRDYIQRRTAATLGKHGGRPPRRVKAPHLLWLENAMQRIQSQCPQATLTAKEHRQELLLLSDIAGEDERGRLIFTDHRINRFELKIGQVEPSISDVAIRKALTVIRKLRL